jgi:hypothetical protein
VPPQALAQVEADTAQGRLVVNGVALRRGETYTLGYFAGGYGAPRPVQTTLACAYTFTTV